jgi:Rrf2 family protein
MDEMRISAKGRYALASTISMAATHITGEYITLISISEKLGISKIYLEQVFALLKRGGIVNSIKGSQGGYQLARMPRQISLYDVLSSVEASIFESVEDTVSDKAPEIEAAMRISAFEKIDEAQKSLMKGISIEQLAEEAAKLKSGGASMFYI